MYRDLLQGGPVLLSNSQAGPGRKFSQPRDHFVAHLCMLAGFGIIGVRSVGSVFGSGARCSVRPGPGERGRWKQEVVFGHYGTPLILPFIDLGEKVMVR